MALSTRCALLARLILAPGSARRWHRGSKPARMLTPMRVCRWRVVDLRNKVEATCGVSVSPETVRSTLPCHGVLSCLAASASSQGGSCETGGIPPEFPCPGTRCGARHGDGRDDRRMVSQTKPAPGNKGMLSRGRKGRRPRILRDQRFAAAPGSSPPPGPRMRLRSATSVTAPTPAR